MILSFLFAELLIICFISLNLFLSRKEIKHLKIEKLELENDALKNKKDIENLQSKKSELEKELEEQKDEIRDKYNKLLDAEKRESNEKGQKKSLEETIKKHNELIEHAKKELTSQFKNTANTILEEKSKAFSNDSKEKVGQLLEPLGKNIKAFQEAVDKNLKENFSEQITLKNLISPLSENIAELTKAMKGDFKVQGDWGETILERILEVSGFIEGVHYHLQGKDQELKTDTGQSAKPDCIFCLPEEKKIIIDSKATIKHAFDYFATEDHHEKQTLLEKHLSAVRDHIKNLSSKNYQNLKNLEGSLDFVVMFIPNDFALFAAFANDEKIQNFAMEKKVMLLSPTLLIPFLQIIKNFFQLYEVNKNTMHISNLAGKMYNQLSGFLEEFSKIKGNIDCAAKSFDSACIKLEGKQGVIKYAEKVKELGAKATKQIPREFLDKAISLDNDDDSPEDLSAIVNQEKENCEMSRFSFQN